MLALADDDSFTNMIKILQDGIVSVRTGRPWSLKIHLLISNESR